MPSTIDWLDSLNDDARRIQSLGGRVLGNGLIHSYLLAISAESDFSYSAYVFG